MQSELLETEVDPHTAGFGRKPLAAMIRAQEPTDVSLAVSLALYLYADIADHPIGLLQHDRHVQVVTLSSQRQVARGGNEVSRLIEGVWRSTEELAMSWAIVDLVVGFEIAVLHPAQDEPLSFDMDHVQTPGRFS